jgi:hypothetical protein
MTPHEDPTQEIRVVLLVIGASIGLAGMMLNVSWLVYVAIGVLAIGGILAIIRRWKIRQSERDESTLES